MPLIDSLNESMGYLSNTIYDFAFPGSVKLPTDLMMPTKFDLSLILTPPFFIVAARFFIVGMIPKLIKDEWPWSHDERKEISKKEEENETSKGLGYLANALQVIVLTHLW